MYIKGIVLQVGYLLELYRDARSPEYKKTASSLQRRRRMLFCDLENQPSVHRPSQDCETAGALSFFHFN
jgi:hypothetical protein